MLWNLLISDFFGFWELNFLLFFIISTFSLAIIRILPILGPAPLPPAFAARIWSFSSFYWDLLLVIGVMFRFEFIWFVLWKARNSTWRLFSFLVWLVFVREKALIMKNCMCKFLYPSTLIQKLPNLLFHKRNLYKQSNTLKLTHIRFDLYSDVYSGSNSATILSNLKALLCTEPVSDCIFPGLFSLQEMVGNFHRKVVLGHTFRRGLRLGTRCRFWRSRACFLLFRERCSKEFQP